MINLSDAKGSVDRMARDVRRMKRVHKNKRRAAEIQVNANTLALLDIFEWDVDRVINTYLVMMSHMDEIEKHMTRRHGQNGLMLLRELAARGMELKRSGAASLFSYGGGAECRARMTELMQQIQGLQK